MNMYSNYAHDINIMLKENPQERTLHIYIVTNTMRGIYLKANSIPSFIGRCQIHYVDDGTHQRKKCVLKLRL